MQTDRFSSVKSEAKKIDVGLRNHMMRVYNRMTIGILITAITAWIVGSSPMLMSLFLGGPQKYIVIFAPLAIIWFGFNPLKMSSQKLMGAFVAVSIIYGISFSTIALVYAQAEIARAFFITSAMFAGLSIFGYTTKKDLSAIGTFLFMGILGLVLVQAVGIFIEYSSQMQMFISIGAVVLFAGLTAWETQNTKRMYNAGNSDEINSRFAWAAALTLYISFVAMFQHILHLMSNR